MPLKRIKQTSKTMIIEEFCTSGTAPDLCTILRNEDVEQKSEFFTLIENNLEVKSYEEFVEKFMPSVWEWCEQSGDSACPVAFRYSLEKPKENVNAHEMRLSSNEFYTMVMDLYSRKGSSGESNLEFDYSRVADLLSPRKVLENAKQLRKDLDYTYNKMQKLEEGAKTERNECVRRIKNIRKEIISQYNDSLTGKIKLALADTEEKLAALSVQHQEGEGDTQSEKTPRLPCKIKFSENGDLDIEVLKIEDNASVIEEEEKGSNELAVLIGQDFDKHSDDNNTYIKELVVSNYCNIAPTTVLNREELIEKRNQYTTIFKASQEQFIRAISSAVEKILNVKVFFEQASIPGRKLPASVIITNCKADKLIEDETVKKKFAYFIKEAGREFDDWKIWFAIIPAIGDTEFVDTPDADEELWDDIDMDEESAQNYNIKTADGEVLVSLDTVKILLNILKTGKIITFFNYRANEKTGFGKFRNEILKQYREKLQSINGNEYAVFTYPNFTVLPKKETAVEIGKTTQNNCEKKEFLDIPGIYVDSSYVAAGLVVASQNPEYLKQKYKDVEDNNPCVRFDLEEENNRFIMLTNMNREGKGVWSSDVEDNIERDKFGFCFCGNTKFYKNERVNNTYVYTSRTMHRDEKGIYDPIYTRLTMDFIMQYLRTENEGGNKYKRLVIEQFIKDTVGEWKRQLDKINIILHEKEDVVFEDGILKVKFRGYETEITLDIEKE